MTFQLHRHPENPIMLPDPSSDWENINVFNPSVLHHNGLFHMHYRAEGMDWVSRIGYAVSRDGVHWNRLRQPVLEPEHEYEIRGVQDARVTGIEGIFYMMYTGWPARVDGQANKMANAPTTNPCIAVSQNLIEWERLGPMVEGEQNKDHVLFPRKINGRFLAFHRRYPDVWLAYSDDLKTWHEQDMTTLCGARPDLPWEGERIGMNGVPIETDAGWICFYHAKDAEGYYRLGVMLLDKQDPSRILSRPRDFILQPEEVWEIRGDVPNVVFSNANILVGDTVYVYYGGGDHVIALATCKLDELIQFLNKQ